MKKIILFIIILLTFSGCSVQDEYFKLECKKVVKTTDIADKIKKLITYNNHDVVTNVIITRTFTTKNDDGKDIIKNIKESMEDYNNDLISAAIKVSIKEDTENKYKVVYYLDVENMTDLELDTLDVDKDWLKYQKKLDSDNLKCQRKK